MDPNEGQENPNQRPEEKRESAVNRAQAIRRDYSRVRTGVNAGRQVATQGGKVAVQAGRAAAQAGVQTTQATVQATQAAIQATIAAIQATMAFIQAGFAAAQTLIATAEVWVPAAAIVAGVILAIMFISAAFMFFFVGTPPPKEAVGQGVGGMCEGICQAATPCATGYTEDTTKTCNTTAPVCCVSAQQCSDIAGICEAKTTPPCPPGYTQDTSGAICSVSTTPTCCVPSNARPPLKFFCQYDTWNYTGCSIYNYGCFPTSLAMILYTFAGGSTTYTPSYVSQNNMDPVIGLNIGCGSGNGWSGTTTRGDLVALKWAENNGYVVGPDLANNNTISLSDLQNYTSNYYLLATGMIPFLSSGKPQVGGHAIVIESVNVAANTITYFDPTYCAHGTSNTAIEQTINIDQIPQWWDVWPIKKP